MFCSGAAAEVSESRILRVLVHLAGVGASQSPVVRGEALTLNSSPVAAVPKYVLYSKESLLL